jgi:3-dehydroquinate dehydratase
VGSIAGFGGLSYELAVVALAEILQQRATAGP